MKYILVFILGIFSAIGLAYLLPEQEGRYYDCGMAEWHPDIPTQVREECQKLRYEQWKKENDKNTI
jgi:hypothetical protein